MVAEDDWDGVDNDSEDRGGPPSDILFWLWFNAAEVKEVAGSGAAPSPRLVLDVGMGLEGAGGELCSDGGDIVD